MKPDDIEDLDPGLARERTELAWTRTAIAFAAPGASVLNKAPPAGIVILGMSALIYLLGRVSRPRNRAQRPERRSPLLLVTVAVTTIALIALALTALRR